MGEHTKGPWEAVPARGYEKRGWVEVVDHRNRPVVGVDSFERHSCDESECPECHHGVRIKPEDARLIAAAPELLEALEGLLQCVHLLRNSDAGYSQEAQAARAAIAKARGTR